MHPKEFEESNATFNPPAGKTEQEIAALKGWIGRLNGEADDVRIITRWKPVREEVEALATGASVWLHILGRNMPPVAMGCANPFEPVVQVAGSGREVDESDPMEITEALAAMDVLRIMFKCEMGSPEDVLEKVSKFVHEAKKRHAMEPTR